jgi:hypothetical protein
MATIAENWTLIFFAEGDDAIEYIDLIDDEGEPAVLEDVVGGKLEDIDAEDCPEPDDDDDEVFEDDDGYVLVYNRRHERVWIYELTDDEDEL